MPLLEALHRRQHVGIERRRVAARLAQIAGGDEPPPELDHVRVAHADLEFLVGRHARPAAARDEVLVDVDRLLHRRHGLRRQDRRRGRDGARDVGLRIEALRPLRLLDAVQRASGRMRPPGREEWRKQQAAKAIASVRDSCSSAGHRRSAPARAKPASLNGALSIAVSRAAAGSTLILEDVQPRPQPRRFSCQPLWPIDVAPPEAQ